MLGGHCMKLLYIPYSCAFFKDDTGNYSMPAYGNGFWTKYLNDFDELTILGEPTTSKNDLVRLEGNIKLEIIPANSRPSELKNDKTVRMYLNKYIKNAEAILIQATSRKGMMAIKIAEKYDKAYFIEVTGDIHLSLSTSNSMLKRMYAPILYKQILRSIKRCKYGLYVTNYYLQNKYPIAGLQCGCTDTNLLETNDEVLESRIRKIKNTDESCIYKIGLIGAYSNNRKGVDTAIKALSFLKSIDYELHILGFGVEEDRRKWLAYAEQYENEEKIVFDKPLKTTEEVFAWIDLMDICILPSRSEGLPRCVIESNSRACPAIISNVCGNVELIDSEWSHDPEDYMRLSQLINKMITNRDLMIDAAITNFRNSQKYTIEKQNMIRHNFFCEFKKYVMENK